MAKRDLKQELGHLYAARGGKPQVVDVPAFTFLMVDGQGDPNTSKAFAEAVEALFAVSYAAKFKIKQALGGIDYAVMPLEGLWWAEDPEDFVSGRKDRWQWTAMIHQPAFVPASVLEEVRAEAGRKKTLPGLARLRRERFEEGRCAQVLHLGPFAEEGPVIARLHAFIDRIGRRRGRHHEIYLSDLRRAAPAKGRTIIRQPFA